MDDINLEISIKGKRRTGKNFISYALKQFLESRCNASVKLIDNNLTDKWQKELYDNFINFPIKKEDYWPREITIKIVEE